MVGFFGFYISPENNIVSREWLDCSCLHEEIISKIGASYKIGHKLENGDIILVNANSYLDPNIKPGGFIIDGLGFVGSGILIGSNFSKPISTLRKFSSNIEFVSHEDALLVHIFG